jgi:hypothetical protein
MRNFLYPSRKAVYATEEQKKKKQAAEEVRSFHDLMWVDSFLYRQQPRPAPRHNGRRTSTKHLSRPLRSASGVTAMMVSPSMDQSRKSLFFSQLQSKMTLER